MPANWYQHQHLNNGRIEWPAGLINAQPGFNPTWIQAWAVQGGQLAQGQFWTGPSQSTNQSVWSGLGPGATTWKATEPGWIEGKFQPGWALGIALLALENGAGTYEYEWWYGHIILS